MQGVFGRLSFGSIRGIPISASGSWLLVVGVLIWFLGSHLQQVTTLSTTAAVLLASATVLLFFASVVAHELGHAIAAVRSGLRVEGIDLWMFGGFARLSESPRSPAEELKISLAGPAVTLLLAILFLGIADLAGPGNLADAIAGDGVQPVVAMLALLGTLNAIVLVLNLLPAYPLDGGRVARALAWKVTGDAHRATRMAAGAGQTIGLALIAGGIALVVLGGATADGFSIALLGWLVAVSARASSEGAVQQQRLDQITVGAIAQPMTVMTDGHHTVLEATEDGGPPAPWVVIRSDDGTPKLLSAAAIDDAMAKGQPALTLAELADDLGDRTIAGDTPLRALTVDPRLSDGGPLLALDSRGEPLGIVTGTALQRAVVLDARSR